MRKLIVLSLAFVMGFAPLTRTVHAENQSTDVEKTANIKTKIVKRVANKKTHVKIKLRDGRELKGRIEQAGDDRFTITEDKTGKKSEIAYSEVEKVDGRGLSKTAKIGIIAAIGVGVLAITVVVALKNFNPFEGGLGHVPP